MVTNAASKQAFSFSVSCMLERRFLGVASELVRGSFVDFDLGSMIPHTHSTRLFLTPSLLGTFSVSQETHIVEGIMEENYLMSEHGVASMKHTLRHPSVRLRRTTRLVSISDQS